MQNLEERKHYLGSSDVAGVLGLSRWKTPYEVWEEKVGMAEPQKDNPVLEWGRILERPILEYYEKQTGNKITIHDKQPLLLHPEHKFLGTHLDADVTFSDTKEEGVVEAKSVASTAYKHWKEGIPLEYFCQMQHHLFVSGRSRGDFALFIMDSRQFEIFNAVLDLDYIKVQNAALIKFWNENVVPKVAPQMNASDFEDSLNLIEASVEADTPEIEAYYRLLEVKKEIAEREALKEQLEETLKVKMGEKTILMNGMDTLATWKGQSRTSVDSTRLKKELPDTFHMYSKTSTFRVLRLKEPKS